MIDGVAEDDVRLVFDERESVAYEIGQSLLLCWQAGLVELERICGGDLHLRVALHCLARNLEIAGALCAAFDQGFDEGLRDGDLLWEPNVDGRAWERRA